MSIKKIAHFVGNELANASTNLYAWKINEYIEHNFFIIIFIIINLWIFWTYICPIIVLHTYTAATLFSVYSDIWTSTAIIHCWMHLFDRSASLPDNTFSAIFQFLEWPCKFMNGGSGRIQIYLFTNPSRIFSSFRKQTVNV